MATVLSLWKTRVEGSPMRTNAAVRIAVTIVTGQVGARVQLEGVDLGIGAMWGTGIGIARNLRLE